MHQITGRELHQQMFGGEDPVIVCHPRMERAAQLIAHEFADWNCRVHLTSFFKDEDSVTLLDPFQKIDPLVVEYVKNRYGPGHTWSPEDAYH
jgi:hypothetical protein